MKLYFKETKRAKGLIELNVIVSDLNPLVAPFKADIGVKQVKEGTFEYELVLSAFGARDWWVGGQCTDSLMIHQGTWDTEATEAIKQLFKKKLKPTLEKYGYLDGISQETIR